MTINDIARAPEGSQGLLWSGIVLDPKGDQKAGNHRRFLTWIGDEVERLVCDAVGFDQIPIDGRKRICPDAEATWQEKLHFLEIKASFRKGDSSKVLLYQFRLEKERIAAALPEVGAYSYAVLEHSTRFDPEMPRRGLRRAVLETYPKLYVLPVSVLYDFVIQTPSRKFTHISERAEKNNDGWSREGYADGGWTPCIRRVLENWGEPSASLVPEIEIFDPMNCLS